MAVNILEMGTVYDALELKIIGTLTTEYDAGRLKGKEYSEVMTAAISALISSSVSSVLEQPVKDAQVNLIEEQILASTASTTRENTDSEKKRELIDEQILESTSETAVKEAMKEAQVLDLKVKDFVLLAESEKDRQLKDAQVMLAYAQVTAENAKVSSLAIHDAIAEATNVVDITLKNAQKLLIDKQGATEDAKALLTARQTLGYNDQARVKRAEILNNTVGMFGAGGTAVPADFTATALAAAKAVSTEALIIPAG